MNSSVLTINASLDHRAKQIRGGRSRWADDEYRGRVILQAVHVFRSDHWVCNRHPIPIPAIMKVSVAQTHPEDGPRTFSPEATASPEFDVFADIRQNLVGVTQSVKTASDSGASLVVFPEYFTQGSLDGRGVGIKADPNTKGSDQTFSI